MVVRVDKLPVEVNQPNGKTIKVYHGSTRRVCVVRAVVKRYVLLVKRLCVRP